MPPTRIITPNYFDPVVARGVHYSFNGSSTAPRTLAKGGYISFYDHASGAWWQQMLVGDEPEIRRLGSSDSVTGSVRSWIDTLTPNTALIEGLSGEDEPLKRARALGGQWAACQQLGSGRVACRAGPLTQGEHLTVPTRVSDATDVSNGKSRGFGAFALS